MPIDDLTIIVDELGPDTAREIDEAVTEFDAHNPRPIENVMDASGHVFKRMSEPWECEKCAELGGGKLCGFHTQVGFTPRNRAERRSAAKRAKRSARA